MNMGIRWGKEGGGSAPFRVLCAVGGNTQEIDPYAREMEWGPDQRAM